MFEFANSFESREHILSNNEQFLKFVDLFWKFMNTVLTRVLETGSCRNWVVIYCFNSPIFFESMILFWISWTHLECTTFFKFVIILFKLGNVFWIHNLFLKPRTFSKFVNIFSYSRIFFEFKSIFQTHKYFLILRALSKIWRFFEIRFWFETWFFLMKQKNRKKNGRKKQGRSLRKFGFCFCKAGRPYLSFQCVLSIVQVQFSCN